MNTGTSAGGRAGVKDWVDSNFFEAEIAPTRIVPSERSTILQSSFDLKSGCEVRELQDGDTIPAELVEFFK